MAHKPVTNDCSGNTSSSFSNQIVKVLHVDDDLDLLSTSKQILELQSPFEVETVSTVREALKKLVEQSFDVVVSDYQMPEKDGLTFLKELRETDNKIPFILFTGKGREEVAIKALNIGADYYLNKLGHPETVYSQLSHYILQAVNKRKAEQKLSYKLEFESVISRISSRFVNPQDFDSAINMSLEDVGRTSGASRVWLFLLNENQTDIKNVYEWCSKSAVSQLEILKRIILEQISWGLNQLRVGKIIQLPDVSKLPLEVNQIKEFLESKNIKSILVLPLFEAGELAGLIALNNVHHTEFWGSDDVALLQIVSELIGNSLERKKTEEKLKDSEKKYRLLTENTTDVVYIQDVNLNVTYVTPSVKNVAGYSPEELMKLTPDKFMTPESFKRGVADFQEAVTLSEKDPDYKIPFKQYEYVRKDGSTFWGELKLKLLHDSEGNLLGTQGTLRDITDRKQTEEKLRQSEKEHRLLTENIIDVIFIIDLNLETTYVSPSIKTLLGYSPEEICQLKTKDFMAPESYERGAVDFAEAISSDAEKPNSEIPLKQYEYIRKDGTKFWGELKTRVLRDSEGRPVGFQGTLRDVTGRKRTEEKLKAREGQYRLLTENITDVVFIQDLEMNITYASPSIEAVTGYAPEEALTLKPIDFLSPDSYESALINWKKAISLADKLPDGHVRLMQYEYVRKDGSFFWGELKVKFLRDENGQLIGTQGVLRDITDRKKTEDKLKDSEEKYRLLSENASDVVFVQDKDLCITYASPSVEAMMGYTPDEVTKLTLKDLMTPESYELAMKNWNKATALPQNGVENDIRLMQYEYVRKDGSIFWGEIKAKVFFDSKGQLLGTQGILRDITERKKIEEKLKESEKQYRLLTENTTDVIFVQNLDMSIRYVSPSVEALSGYTPEEVINLGPIGLMTPESFKRGLVEIQADLAKSAQDPNFEPAFRCYEYRCKDGSRRWGEFKPKILRDSQGNIEAMQGTLRDVTNRKKVEDALREEQKKLETVTDTLKVGLAVISEDFKILWANKYLTDPFGDVQGKTCYSLFNDHGTVCPNCGVKEIFETGKNHVVCEQSIPGPNGKRSWVELTANPIRDEHGNIIAVSELSVIIDERKKMENKLREAEKRYRFLFDKAPVGIAILDLDGSFVEFNDVAHQQLGYSREEFEQLNLSDFDVHQQKNAILARMKRIEEFGKDNFETKHLAKNGEIRDIIIMVQLIDFDGKPFLYCIARDITEHKKAEMELLNSEKKYREMINAMTDVVWVIDFDGKITDVNDSAVNVLGYSQEELLSMEVKQIDLDADAIEAEGICERLRAGFTQIFRSVYTTKNGKKVPVEVNANPVTYAGKQGILCIARDVTERKQAEESMDKIMKELLVINEKLSVVGKLTRHDVRNKLSVISNNIYLARKQLTQNKDVSQYFAAIDSAVDQVTRIFSFARTYEQLGVEELSYIDVKQSVDEAVSLFSGIDGIQFVNGCSGLSVMADSLLRQIFYNFIDDSLKHGEKVTEIKVYYEQKLDHINLIYRDDGVGIPEPEKEISFKEGYGKDTGYGLYLIRKICEAYGWIVTEIGKYGEGVQFVIRIPKICKNDMSIYKIELD